MHRFLGFKAESLLWSHSAPGGPGILQSWTRPGTTCSRHPVLVKKSRELEQHQDLPERYGYNWSKQWISSVRIAVANCRSSIPPQTKQYPLHITVYEWLRQLDLLFFCSWIPAQTLADSSRRREEAQKEVPGPQRAPVLVENVEKERNINRGNSMKNTNFAMEDFDEGESTLAIFRVCQVEQDSFADNSPIKNIM